MQTIHLVHIEVCENYNRLNSQKPNYAEFYPEYDCAFPTFEIARTFAKNYLKELFGYLGNDEFLEFADYDTDMAIWYNGGRVAVASIEAYDYSTTPYLQF